MFYQDAYAPKPLDSKGLHYTRRSQTTTGPSAKPITKYEILRPYFDYDISAAHASKIAQGFLRYKTKYSH
ncbi:hypothetical protein NQ318_008213 [Aromia moschata]|uniref:Uncharacterized protein n=1 Tax=Aromia moschata TaxID=1265417 RepID=A0AAV8YJG2_9CUCU|nr:hypothetical protein NQ318_008213 [Aromia moschata]